jgi:acyl-CoA-binding protein
MGADEFDYAAERVFDLPRTPDNNTLLELYKLYF